MREQSNFRAYKGATFTLKAVYRDKGIRKVGLMNQSAEVFGPGFVNIELVFARRSEFVDLPLVARYLFRPFCLLLSLSWLPLEPLSRRDRR